jgi:glutamine synthetase
MIKKKPFPKNFASNVFTASEMKKRLSDKTYHKVLIAQEGGENLDPEAAQQLADAMKDWAIESGATHFTHWFQPMTGFTAEKHDSFLYPAGKGKAIARFSYKELIKGEPDASSFPSGGLRATFEARGYTAWDMSSPAFLKEDEGGVTLCIPTAFCSYTGEALDKKTPLLRSMDAISRSGVRLLHLLGKNDVKKLIPSVGPEQEYFLIHKDHYLSRPDLVYTGRTLFGAKPPKGQEMEDHYFASIREPIAAFMRELDEELWKMGVLSKTKHNEVAPSQHEIAPMYNSANIATDHNQLVMETLKKIAGRHDLVCLLHEKPFATVNGSGKHNNWSVMTDTGENMFDPGKTPQDNMLFLIFVAALIRGIDIHADLIRASAATPGNDHRLGANEAPPAIISIFLGETLSDVFEVVSGGKPNTTFSTEHVLNIGSSVLPPFPKDSTDRNRTSPFAFTSNKFEFRMVPSTASISAANFTLNTVLADSLDFISDQLEKFPTVAERVAHINTIVGKIYNEHKRVVFNGNNYSEEWVKEAAKRGLPNIASTVEAAKAIIAPKSVEMYAKHKVFTETELESRYEIVLEGYIKTINIEARTLIDLVNRYIIPSVSEYRASLASSVKTLKEVGSDTSVEVERLAKGSKLLSEANERLSLFEKNLTADQEGHETYAHAVYFKDKVFTAMGSLRHSIDGLEEIVSADYWPFPTYGEILYHIR